MDNHNVLVEKLKEAYKGIFEANQPDWAVHKITKPAELVRPTIPFVGKKYAEQKTKILVYASAETLNDHYYGKTTRPWLDCNNEAIDRHRRNFEISKTKDDYFPDVHISPMNDGALAIAVYYLALKFGGLEYDSPQEFYETIAFGNYGKFTIETERQKNIRLFNVEEGNNRNIDYTSICKKEAREKLGYSVPYLEKDIVILNPDIIILPASLYCINKQSFDSIMGNATVIPIYQINAGIINRTIHPNFQPLASKDLPCSVQKWYEQLNKGGFVEKTKDNYLSLFPYLDSILK